MIIKKKNGQNYKHKIIVRTFFASLILSILISLYFLPLTDIFNEIKTCSNSEVGCPFRILGYTIIFLVFTAGILIVLSVILLPLAWLFEKYRKIKNQSK